MSWRRYLIIYLVFAWWLKCNKRFFIHVVIVKHFYLIRAVIIIIFIWILQNSILIKVQRLKHINLYLRFDGKKLWVQEEEKNIHKEKIVFFFLPRASKDFQNGFVKIGFMTINLCKTSLLSSFYLAFQKKMRVI